LTLKVLHHDCLADVPVLDGGGWGGLAVGLEGLTDGMLVGLLIFVGEFKVRILVVCNSLWFSFELT
jgi:hypothetical protein